MRFCELTYLVLVRKLQLSGKRENAILVGCGRKGEWPNDTKRVVRAERTV